MLILRAVRRLTLYQNLDWSKFKAFADDQLKVAQVIKFLLDGVKTIVTSIFSFSDNVFKSPLSQSQ